MIANARFATTITLNVMLIAFFMLCLLLPNASAVPRRAEIDSADGSSALLGCLIVQDGGQPFAFKTS